ncbi:MAG: alpha/beta hydrolase [Candidatus Eiseniibacteriota bacterium]
MARIVSGVEVPGPAGPLEGLWADPGHGLPAAVICHPHPAHSGSMHSKVVHTVHRVLDQAGHPTLRFNFRGVGTSGGVYSGGEGEIQDVAAAAAFAREKTGIEALWLAGFSFGSYVGARWALGDSHLERFIGLGMPVDGNVDGRTFDFLARPPAPMLIVQGDRDQYGSREGILALVARLKPLGAIEARFVTDADHFFTGRLAELARELRAGLGLEER